MCRVIQICLRFFTRELSHTFLLRLELYKVKGMKHACNIYKRKSIYKLAMLQFQSTNDKFVQQNSPILSIYSINLSYERDNHLSYKRVQLILIIIRAVFAHDSTLQSFNFQSGSRQRLILPRYLRFSSAAVCREVAPRRPVFHPR